MSENPPPQDRPYQPPQQPKNQPPPAYPQPPQYGQPPPQPPQYGAAYQQQYSGQTYGQQYGQGQYSYPAAPVREHPRATLAFVLGLLSVLGLTILGPFGWYVGRKVIREIDTNPRAYTNRGLAMAGMVLGIIGTIFLILIALVIVLAIVVAIVGGGSSRRGSSVSPNALALLTGYWL